NIKIPKATNPDEAVNLEQLDEKANLDDIKDGKFEVEGVGALEGSGTMTANQENDTNAELDLTQDTKDDIQKGVTAHGWGDYRDFGLGDSVTSGQNINEDFSNVVDPEGNLYNTTQLTKIRTGTELRSNLSPTDRPTGWVMKGAGGDVGRWSWMGVTDKGELRAFIANSENSDYNDVLELLTEKHLEDYDSNFNDYAEMLDDLTPDIPV